MYGTLALSNRSLSDLAPAVGDAAIDELQRLARPLEGLRILNLSVTGFGTGTAELLNSSVPLLNDLGLDAHWQVVRASEEAAAVSRAMYQALGGASVQWTQEMTDTWLRYAAMNAELLTEPFDVVVVHDPQPLAIRTYAAENIASTWIAHSHLDLTAAADEVWMLVREHLQRYDAVLLDSETFSRRDISVPTHVVPPAIDPTSSRNMELSADVVASVLGQYGIDHTKPYVCQVSPCDAACDLPGLYDAWRIAKDSFPELQLVVVLFTEPSDAQSRQCYDELVRKSLDDPDAFVITPGNEIGNVELNVFQTAASVVVQKGLRKGYGMWVSDALWKRRPVVVGPEPGLLEQVIDGQTGLVAATTEACAEAIVRIMGDPDLAARLGENGRRHVTDRFLISRYLRDDLTILTEVHRKNAT
jgi:trehalose synthase